MRYEECKRVKKGDIVICLHDQAPDQTSSSAFGIVVGFNKKGEGGHDFVHVLIDKEVRVYMFCDLQVVKTTTK
mgnify:CR=1 FL=1